MSSSNGGLGQVEEVTQDGNTTRVVVKRQGGGPNLVIQIKNDAKSGFEDGQSHVQAANVLSQLLKTVSVSEDGTKNTTSNKKKLSSKLDVMVEEKKAKAEERREQNMTPLMKAATVKGDGNLVRKEIIQIKKRNNRENGGDVIKLQDFLNQIEKDDISADYATCKIAKAKGNKASSASTDTSSGWTAVHFACDNVNYDGLRYLLDAGASPNIKDRMGATPLHLVILAAGRYPLEQKLMNGENHDSESHGENMSSFGTFEGKKSSLPKSKDDGYEYLNDFLKCAKLLLNNPKFELMKNERREDDFNATKQSTKVLKKGNFDPILKSLPEDDGFGISPICLCVCQGYTGRDALYPILEFLLTRGFDPNARLCGFSALQIALRNMHYGCALALTRAGANINEPHREDGKSAVQAAELIFGDAFARELREASVVALAVADPIGRRDMLRTMGADGAKELANRALNTGHSFIKTSRWREAAGAYTESALYGPNALSKADRFECLKNIVECYLKVERGGLKAEEVATTLLKEFPDVPLAMVLLGEAISHPSSGKLISERLDLIGKLVNDALELEKKSDGKEWWRSLELQSNTTLFRILQLKGLVDDRNKEEQNPAVKFANSALDEYFTVGGSIEKAAFAIQLAMKPNLNHPSPLPLHGIRGFIYYSWASEILRANSFNGSDRDSKDGFGRIMAPLKDKLSYKEAHEKILIAYNEFEYYNKMNDRGAFPKLMYGFNIAKTKIAIGKFEDGKESALISIRERTEVDLIRLDDNTPHRKSAFETTQDDHFEGDSTQKLILQLSWALDMYRMLLTQTVMDWAINLDATNPEEPPFRIEPEVMQLNLKQDTINSNHLKMVLDKMIKSFKMIDRNSAKKLQSKICTSPAKINTAIRGLLSAMKKIEYGHRVMKSLRLEAAKILIHFVLGAHERQQKNGGSSRVIGTLLMEAYEWDPDVLVPRDLPKVYLKMAQDQGFRPNL